jgi:hypothetical protein
MLNWKGFGRKRSLLNFKVGPTKNPARKTIDQLDKNSNG